MPLEIGRWRILLFLLQLPFTLWPACISLLIGVPFATYLDGQDRQAAHHWDNDVGRDFGMNRWNAMAPVEPYMVPSLWSTEWQNQLGFRSTTTSHGATITSFGALEYLEALPGVPSQWVYLPESGPNMTAVWDSAFDQLVQYHYIHPPTHEALFSFLDPKTAPFLETIWHVKRPALVFFSVADSSSDDQRVDDEKKRSRGHRRTPQSPVSVHVAELPLPHSLPDLLLSCFDQMLLLTNGTIQASSLPQWNFFSQAQARFRDRYEQARSRSRALSMINRVDSFLTEYLPILNSQRMLRQFYVVTINVPLFAFELYNHYLAPAWQQYVATQTAPLMIEIHPDASKAHLTDLIDG